MADKIKSNRRFRYAIVQTDGYGDNESGHVVSYHTSLENAWKRWNRTIEGTTGIYTCLIVEIQHDGHWLRPWGNYFVRDDGLVMGHKPGTSFETKWDPIHCDEYEVWSYENLVEVNMN